MLARRRTRRSTRRTIARAVSPAFAMKGPVRGSLLFWRSTMNSVALIRTEADADPRLVLFGRDGAGKPRASWFDASAADLALKAAELMKLRVLRLETDEHKALARQLSPGRVFDSGRAFTPFVRANVFGKLAAQRRSTPQPAWRDRGDDRRGDRAR